MSEIPTPGYEAFDRQATAKIVLDREAIHAGPLALGGTEIVLQRHGEYISDRDDPQAGRLTPAAVQRETDTARRYFSELISCVPEDEKDSLNVLFLSSDTSYANNGQRSYQTTEIAQQAAERLFQANGIHLLSILNISPDSKHLGNPIAVPTLGEPQMFDTSPKFVRFMRSKYGDPNGNLGKQFWVAFEEDVERETRLEMGAEGPDEIADRLGGVLRSLKYYSEVFHAETPGSRLAIWAGTHHDTISPFVKRDVLHTGKTTPVLVDYGGGVVIDIDPAGRSTTTISGYTCQLSL